MCLMLFIRKQFYNEWRVCNTVSTSETCLIPKGVIWVNNSSFQKGSNISFKVFAPTQMKVKVTLWRLLCWWIKGEFDFKDQLLLLILASPTSKNESSPPPDQSRANSYSSLLWFWIFYSLFFKHLYINCIHFALGIRGAIQKNRPYFVP